MPMEKLTFLIYFPPFSPQGTAIKFFPVWMNLGALSENVLK
jgi:hypothetical protein